MEDEVEEVESRPPSARRNFSLRNSAARQVAINFMPSRHLPGNTIRMKRSNSEHNALLEEATDAPDSAEKRADIIVRELEQHQRLMEDNPGAEELRREALRDLPQGLTMKRHVRAKLSVSVSLRSKSRPISLFKRLKYRMSFAWKRTRDRLRDLTFSVELWYEAIRSIEGNFGSAVGSFFYFLRWLFVLDAALAGALVAFVVVPQALFDQRAADVDWGFLDFFSGKGFSDSLLFYGHYHAGDVATPPLSYNMPFAYFFTMLSLYLLFFAVLCYRTALSYRRNFIETARGGLSHVFAGKVLCGWDFGVTTPRARALHASSIYYEFKELLSEQTKNKTSKSFWTRLGQRAANVAVTAFVLVSIVGLEYGFLLLLRRESKMAHWEILLSLGITVAVTVCPLLFGLIVKLEYYKPRTAVYVTLARTGCLDVGTLMLLMYYWSNANVECWETAIGQEAYRLVLLDAVVSLLVLPVIEFVRALIFKLNPKSTAPEFNIAYNSLTIIYNQAVLWFGMLFSPLLVVAVTFKFLLLFYVKRECALRACQPARKIWRAAQTQTVLYMLVTLSLFTTLFGIGTLFLGTTSQSCGPFTQYESVFAVLTEGVLGLSRRGAARAALAFAARPGVIGFLALALCVWVYYMRAKALAQNSMVEILRHMLVLQAKDKDFLLNAIAKVSNGEWMYSPKPEEQANSHTWKYLNEVRKPSNSDYHFDASRLNHSILERTTKSRPNSYQPERPKSRGDGDTDSSFSWQGSSGYLNKAESEKKWI